MWSGWVSSFSSFNAVCASLMVVCWFSMVFAMQVTSRLAAGVGWIGKRLVCDYKEATCENSSDLKLEVLSCDTRALRCDESTVTAG
jgi:hypothetical protein